MLRPNVESMYEVFVQIEETPARRTDLARGTGGADFTKAAMHNLVIDFIYTYRSKLQRMYVCGPS